MDSKIKGLVCSLFYKFGKDWLDLRGDKKKNPVKKCIEQNAHSLRVSWLSYVCEEHIGDMSDETKSMNWGAL